MKGRVRVELPSPEQVSDANPAWRASVEMEFDEQTPVLAAVAGNPIRAYEFRLDLGITML